MILSNVEIIIYYSPSKKDMISDNQWRAIGKYMDETAGNIRTITIVVVVSFIANLGVVIWFYSAFN
jgi:hypothetical protein